MIKQDRRAALAIVGGRLCYLERVSDYSYLLDDKIGDSYRIKKHIFSKDRDVYIQAWMMNGRLSVVPEKSIPDEFNPIIDERFNGVVCEPTLVLNGSGGPSSPL